MSVSSSLLRVFRLGLFLPIAACSSFLPEPTTPAQEPLIDLKRADRVAQREAQLAELQLKLLARDAEISRLNGDIEEIKKRLDDAVLEVVRSKAKTGSLGSRAEAATALAESELQLKALRSKLTGPVREAEIKGAERLLAMGNQEFKAGNFGGAFYLASSANISLAMLLSRARGSVPSAADDVGEMRFVVPVKVVFNTRSNVRETPSMESRVVRVADNAMEAVGLANRELWVLVQFADGVRGWVFHDLLTGH